MNSLLRIRPLSEYEAKDLHQKHYQTEFRVCLVDVLDRSKDFDYNAVLSSDGKRCFITRQRLLNSERSIGAWEIDFASIVSSAIDIRGLFSKTYYQTIVTVQAQSGLSRRHVFKKDNYIYFKYVDFFGNEEFFRSLFAKR